MLISCSDIVALYDIESSTKPISTSNRHKGKVNTSIFNHNCRVISSGGEDGVINFFNYNLEYISCIEDAELQGGGITSLAFNNNSNCLAYGSTLGHLKVWDLKNSTTQLNHKLNGNYLTSVCYNLDSTHLSVGTVGGEILNFSMVTFTQTNFKYQTYFKLNQLRYSPLLPNILGTCFEDGQVRVVDMNSGESVHAFTSHIGEATALSFSPINKVFLCSVGKDAKVNFYDIQSKKHVKTITTEAPLTSACFNKDGQTVAFGNANGNILVYDLRFCTAPKSILTGHNSAVNYLEFSKRTGEKSNVLMNSSSRVQDQNMSMKSNRSLSSIDSNIPYHMQGNYNNVNLSASNNKLNQTESKISNKVPNDLYMNPLPNDLKDSKMSKASLNDLNPEQSFDKKRNESFSNNTFVNPIQKNSSSNVPSNLQDNLNKMSVDNNTSMEGVKNKPKFNLNLKNLENINNTNANINKIAPININQHNNIQLNNNPTKSRDEDFNTIDLRTQNFIKSCIETEMFKMRQFIHEEVNSLHIDLVRQFEIQHNELIKSIKNLSLVNNKMNKEVEKLQKENHHLKSKFF